ncbi:MAG: DUF58 domain-containing protein [Actinobacteria bacterium]|nr:DUF58 domain-containing protein [Actinomycetota bacterium]
MSPTRRAATLVALVAVASVLLPVPLAVLAVVAVLTATLADAMSVRGRLGVDRSAPPVVSRGVTSPLTISVVGSPAGTVAVRQPVPAAMSLTPDESDGGLAASLMPTRRGRYRLEPPVLRRTGPLGLGRWDRKVEVDAIDFAVFPNLVAARRIVARVRKGRFGNAGRQARGPLGLGTEFELIREYAPDDDIRQVNWRATARAGRPMSNQYRVEQDRDVIVLLDMGRLMSAPVGDRSRLDVAVDAMTALGLVADELGDRFGVIAFDDTIQRRVAPRRNGGAAAVRACFDVQARSVDSDFSTAFNAVGGAKRALVMVLTDLLDASAAASLVAAVPTLARRHALVVASVRDPDITAITKREPAHPFAVYEASVAASVLAARDQAAAQLRATGATTVDGTPDGLSVACVEAYLSLKARARL